MTAARETWRSLGPVAPILIGAAMLLTFSLGIRQSLGIIMPSLTRDIPVSVSDFTLAVAVQNLVWGFIQPFVGAVIVRLGFRPVMFGGACLYVGGLLTLALAQGVTGVIVGAGVLIGTATACTANAVAMSVTARSVSLALRSTMLGVVSAAGSLGAMIAAPIAQSLLQVQGWRVGVVGFVALALLMLPAAWMAGRVDRIPLPAPVAGDGSAATVRLALKAAAQRPAFVVMSLAYFVCGMQLIFLTTHLPSYLDLCGMEPMLSAQALGMIGGFNVLGSLFFGWAGGRWNKQALLGGIYICRSLVLFVYFVTDPSVTSTLVFAGTMGFLWLGVSPLIAGSVVEMFGLRWQTMIMGLAFVSHQFGSFVGAFGGGLIFDALGSYTLAWQVGVSLGLAAGIVQLGFALARPARPNAPVPSNG